MARADTPTIIPLDRVAVVFGIDPLHFNSIVSDLRAERNACDDIWFQQTWQTSGRVSREDLARALHTAEQRVVDALGYFPLPQWVASEQHMITLPNQPERFNTHGYNTRGQPKSVRANHGKLIEFGVRAKSVIEAGATITYTDYTGDGYKETALVTVTPASTITDREEIYAYYPDQEADDLWEIRPIRVSLGGEKVYDGWGRDTGLTTAAADVTVTFRRDQALLPDNLLAIQDSTGQARAIDGDDDTKFLTTIDVYRVYNDPSTQATFYTIDLRCATDTEPYTEDGALTAKDPERGFVGYYRADWDSDNEKWVKNSFTYGIEPDRIDINYRSGLQNRHSANYPTRLMNPMFERAIALYAMTTIPQEVCGCDQFRNLIMNMAEDKSKEIAQDHRYKITDDDLGNPIGTSKAAIDLWHIIKRNRLSYAR